MPRPPHFFRRFFLATLGLLVAPAAMQAKGGVVDDNEYVRLAVIIALVRAPTVDEAKETPVGHPQRLMVEQVLKGFLALQSIPVVNSLAPGQKAVVLLRTEPPTDETSIKSGGTAPNLTKVWPMRNDQTLDTTGDVPAGWAPPQNLTVSGIATLIQQSTPEAAGLQEQLMAALLFPEKFAALERADAARAKYVRFYLAVRDLERDVPMLAAMLQSPDAATARAVEARLRAITSAVGEAGVKIASLPVDAPMAARHAQAQAWLAFWQREAANLSWDETRASYAPRRAGDGSPRRWPAIPPDGKQPVDVFPPALLDAMAKADPVAFASAFRQWLDSGVVRDRLIHACQQVSIEERARNAAGGVLDPNGQVFDPAPRLQTEMLFSPAVTALGRMQVIALLAQRWLTGRFAAEQVAAVQDLKASNDRDIIHRAAFWELHGGYTPTPGRVAAQRLADLADEPSQHLLASLFVAVVEPDLLYAAQSAIHAGRQVLIADLLAHVRASRDTPARWAARALCVEKQAAVVPLVLPWLTNPDFEVRENAKGSLCYFPTVESVPTLLTIIGAAKDAMGREPALVVLAQTGDKRGLEALLAGLDDSYKIYKEWTGSSDEQFSGVIYMEIARGLARIRDPRALPALAKLAKLGEKTSNLQLTWEAVLAFGHISGRFPTSAPQSYGTGGGMDPIPLALGLADIAKWEQENAAPTTAVGK